MHRLVLTYDNAGKATAQYLVIPSTQHSIIIVFK